VTGILAGTPRYFAWLYGDARLQALLAALFGIETEINAALQPGLEHSVAHVRMTWWAEEAQRLHTGHALHPLTRALLAQWPQAPAAPSAGPDVSGLVEVAAWDLAGATFETRRDLALYCERWARAVVRVATAAAAPDLPPQTVQRFAAEVGAALCELDMLVSLQHAARLGRLRMPLDELAALGVAPEALAQLPWPPALCEWLRERHRELRGALAAGCALLPTPAHRAALRGLLVWAALLERHSRCAQAALPAAWRRTRWDGVHDALRAWRAARRAMSPRIPNRTLNSGEPP
jgi:15-cis-phytoene synthase